MLLKRLYDSKAPDAKVIGVEVLRAGARQSFTPEFLEWGQRVGFLTIAAGKLTLAHGKAGAAGKLIYRILRGPGYYCCHCAAPQADGMAARVHLELAHKGAASPDPNNPAGYRRANAFECEKE